MIEEIKFYSLNSLLEKLKEEGYKSIKNVNNHYINTRGVILCIKEYKNKKERRYLKLKKVSTSPSINGAYKFNVYKSTQKCFLVHDVVYRTFCGDYEGDLVFLDNDKSNCNLDNLITIEELRKYYIRNNLKGL